MAGVRRRSYTCIPVHATVHMFALLVLGAHVVHTRAEVPMPTPVPPPDPAFINGDQGGEFQYFCWCDVACSRKGQDRVLALAQQIKDTADAKQRKLLQVGGWVGDCVCRQCSACQRLDAA